MGDGAGNSVAGLTDLPAPPFCSCALTAPKTKPLFNTAKERIVAGIRWCAECLPLPSQTWQVELPPDLSTKYRCALHMAHCNTEDASRTVVKPPALYNLPDTAIIPKGYIATGFKRETICILKTVCKPNCFRPEAF